MSLQTCTPDDPDAIYQALEEDGGVVVENLFPASVIDPIRAAIDDALTRVPWCNTAEEGYGEEFFGHKTKRLHGVLQYSSQIESCLMHQLPLSMAERWLTHKPQFSTGEVMAIGGGELQQDLHTDAGSWRKAHLPGELLFSMTIALTDFTETNGATVVAPGSHKWPTDHAHTPADFTPAVMTKGSAFFYSGNVLHSGGANRTDETRIGLYLGYIPFWLQPLENAAVTHPPGCLDQLDTDTQNFLGYHPSGFNAILG